MLPRRHPWHDGPPATALPSPEPSTGPLKVWHFYHVWADGWWPPAVYEHVSAVKHAGMPIDFALVGIIGHNGRADRVREYFVREFGSVEFVQAEEGFEQVTIQAMTARLPRKPVAVMYAHSKGAYHNDEPAALWRRSMTHHLICEWRTCLALLDGNHDAVGCHWKADHRYFAGNFWWARSDYLRMLPPVGMAVRGDAEIWIGRNNPRIADRRPGWPAPEMFRDMHGHGAGQCTT